MTYQVRGVLRRCLRDRNGNVAIVFGFALLPMLGLTALAVDFSRTMAIKTVLDLSADAAALAAVTEAQRFCKVRSEPEDQGWPPPNMLASSPAKRCFWSTPHEPVPRWSAGRRPLP